MGRTPGVRQAQKKKLKSLYWLDALRLEIGDFDERVFSFFLLFFFCVRGTSMSFFDYVMGSSPVQPLPGKAFAAPPLKLPALVPLSLLLTPSCLALFNPSSTTMSPTPTPTSISSTTSTTIPLPTSSALELLPTKITGVVYNNCTSKFPFMSLDGNVCFFVMYHYKTTAILATPIPSLNSNSILKAFKKNFEYLEEKGYKPKLNVMDN
jgi:hypothetical protein